MRFDIPTLFSLLLLQSLALALMLPVLLGWRDSRGARLTQWAAVAQALGWSVLLLPGEGHRVLASLALGLLSVSISLLWLAAQSWWPRLPGRWLQLTLPALLMLGYGSGWDNYAFRLAWSNGCLGLQMLALAGG